MADAAAASSVSESTSPVERRSPSKAPVWFAAWIAAPVDPAWNARIGGLSVAERAVRSAERSDGVRTALILSGRPGAPASGAPASLAETGGTCLAFVRPVLVDPTAIAASARLSQGYPGPIGIRFRGTTPDEPAALWIGSSLSALPPPAGGETVAAPEGVFESVDSPAERAAAARALRRSLAKPTDGFFAAWIDRRISTRWSMRLAATRWTPNAITIAALVVALAGAALLAVPAALWSTAGALLFWLSTILDGCDGEVARLKFQESPGGARLDLLCDNVALVAVFTAVFAHVYLERPGPTVLWLGLAALVGMVGCMATEYFRIQKPRIENRDRRWEADAGAAPAYHPERVRWYERLASRDFAYLLPFLALFGRLSWLAWGTAVGVNAFFLALTFFVLRSRR